MGRPEKLEREEVLRRAMALFWRRGYGATSIRDLEEALELKAPAIYYRFESKPELFEEVVRHYVEEVVALRIERYLDGSGDPVVNLYRFYRTAQSDLGCVLTNTEVDATEHTDRLRSLVSDGVERMRCGILAELRRAQEMGALHGEPEATSRALIVVMHGLMAMCRSDDLEEVRRSTRAVFAAIFPGHPAFDGAA